MIDKELLVVTGKGGVGKSSIAAALGVAAAAEDRRTLVLEVDPRENVHQMLGTPPSGGEMVGVAPNLWLQNLRPLAVVDRIVQDRVRFEAVVRKVLSSTVYRHFIEGAPGLKETAILAHALEVVRGRLQEAPEIDLVILDAPATGHGLSLLTAPKLVGEAIERGPVAELTRQVSDWVGSSEMCGVVVVTLAEDMPVSEALELIEALDRDLSRRPEMAVVNQLYPQLPAGFRARDRVGRLWRRRRELNEDELARLRGFWDGPVVELPLLPLDRGPALAEELAEGLAPWINGEAA